MGKSIELEIYCHWDWLFIGEIGVHVPTHIEKYRENIDWCKFGNDGFIWSCWKFNSNTVFFLPLYYRAICEVKHTFLIDMKILSSEDKRTRRQDRSGRLEQFPPTLDIYKETIIWRSLLVSATETHNPPSFSLVLSWSRVWRVYWL